MHGYVVMEKRFCKCGDSTYNKDGVCDTCKLLAEVEKDTGV
jgi:hypothetical protein